jgi:hypothetical protein
MLTTLQTLARDAELLAFEAGCEDYCEREVDEVEWQGGRDRGLAPAPVFNGCDGPPQRATMRPLAVYRQDLEQRS